MDYFKFFEYIKEFNKQHSDLLIIISAYKNYKILKKHLNYLSKQTFTKFNVLLVIGPTFNDISLINHIKRTKYNFGCIIAKENERRGCSGAFFAGQKYCLANHYRYVIMADDDCFPIDKNLIKILYKYRKFGYVAPTTIFVLGKYKKQGFVAGPTQYSLYSIDLIKKYGLYFMPLFHGSDDGEYIERIKQKPFHIQNTVEHPYIAGMRLFSLFDRQWLFFIHSLIIIKSWRAFLQNLLLFCFMNSISFCFLPSYGKKAFFITNFLVLRHIYGKEAADKLKTGFETFIFDHPYFSNHFLKINETDPSYIDEPLSQKIFTIFIRSISLWRKNILMENTNSFFQGFLLSIFAKKLYIKIKKKKYLLFAENENILFHFLKFSMFPFIFLLQLLICIVFIPIKVLFQPRTYGYGLS